MTPNDIEVLLHCHVCPNPHPRKGAPAVDEAIDMLLRRGMITHSVGGEYYTTTEGGRMLVDALCNTPFPIKAWVMPEKEIP